MQMADIEKNHAKRNKKNVSSTVVRSTRRRKVPVGDAKINVYLGFSSSDEDDLDNN